MSRIAARTVTELRTLAGYSQRGLADAAGVSAATICNIEHGRVPKNWDAIMPRLATALCDGAGDEKTIAAVLGRIGQTEKAPVKKPGAKPGKGSAGKNQKEKNRMILKKQSFTYQAREQFSITRDPFGDPQDGEDIFLCPENRYVREAILSAAKFGNFLAVVGESGSGKSTLVDSVEEQLRIEKSPVVWIKPYVIALSESEKTGKPLKARDIAEAIMLTINKDEGIPSTNEQMFRKLHAMLVEGCTASKKRFVLRIEEAQELNTHTLKTLKRFWEMAEGMRRLLSIILVGQTELGDKLDGTSRNLREVVQRCDVVTLKAIPDVPEFITFRFARAGMNALDIFEPDALAEIRQKLIVDTGQKGGKTDMAYPLAIANLATAAINETAASGFPKVTAGVVRELKA